MATEKWLNKQTSTEIFYNDRQELLGKCAPPVVIAENRLVPNGLFWASLGHKIIYLSHEYSATPVQKECSDVHTTSYGYINIETIMLMLGLMALSWLKLNIKEKTEKGQPLSEGVPANCPIGSRFHGNLYDDYKTILEDFLDKVKTCTPLWIHLTSKKQR